MPFLTRVSSADDTSRDACPTLHRKALEPLGEGLGVLAGQQRGRHHHRHLLAAHHRGEGGAQRHLGLAEADVAADQPVHRPAGGEVLERRVDRDLLVVGFLVGEARGEFVRRAGLHHELRRLAQFALGRDLDQRVGDFADAVLQPRLSVLPAGAAEPIELDAGVLGAVARQKLDVLDRQVELGAFGVVDFQAVVRRAGRFDVLQSDEPPDAVIDMHDEIAGGEARHLGDEIVRTLRRTPRPHQPVAQDVLLADDGGVGGLEAAFEPQHRERDLGLRQRQRLEPRLDRRQVVQTMLGQHVLHALARALAPERDDDALAVHLQRLDVLAHRIEYAGGIVRPLGRKIVAGARADIDRRAALPRHRKRRQAGQSRGRSAARPIRRPAGKAGPAAAACRAFPLCSASASFRAS